MDWIEQYETLEDEYYELKREHEVLKKKYEELLDVVYDIHHDAEALATRLLEASKEV